MSVEVNIVHGSAGVSRPLGQMSVAQMYKRILERSESASLRLSPSCSPRSAAMYDRPQLHKGQVYFKDFFSHKKSTTLPFTALLVHYPYLSSHPLPFSSLPSPPFLVPFLRSRPLKSSWGMGEHCKLR